MFTYREYQELQEYSGMTEDEKLTKRNLEMVRKGMLRKPKDSGSDKDASD